jgi:hypothetical protein
MDLGESFHNLYRFWKTLEAKYGQFAMDHLDIGDEFIRLIFRNKMQQSEKFSTFIVRFNSEADVIQLHVNFRLGLILISPTGPEKSLCLLVERLYPAIEHCRINRTTYDVTTKFLIDADQSITRQETSNIEEVHAEKRVNSIQDTDKSSFKDFKNKEKVKKKSRSKKTCDCGQMFTKWAEFVECCKECFFKAKAEESSGSEDEQPAAKSTKQSNKRYKKKDNTQTKVKAVYILDNDDYEGDQVGDNHVNNYVEASDDEGDNDNIPRAKSARLRTISSKSKHR